MNPKATLKRAAMLAATLALSTPDRVLAAEIQWTAASSSDFNWNNAANWSLGVPTLADTALFVSPIPNPGLLLAPQTITLGVGSLAGTLIMQDSYSLNGGTLILGTGGVRVSQGETVTLGTQLTGTDGLLKTGGGALRLTNGINSYTGVTTISNGSLIINDAAQLGTDTSAIVVSGSATRGFGGGQLVLEGGYGSGVNLARDLSLQGLGPIADRSGSLLSVGNNTISGLVSGAVGNINTRIIANQGTLTLAGGLNVAGVLGTHVTVFGGINAGGASSYILTGPLSGTGTLVKESSGTLILNPSDSSGFAGNVRLSSGTVRIVSPNVFGLQNQIGTAAPIDFRGGTLEVRMDNPVINQNIYQNTAATMFIDHGIGSQAVNGTAAFGRVTFEDGQTLTLNGRNGFGASFGVMPVITGDGNSTINNNLGGLVTYTGDFWSNTNNTASRSMTLGGNGNTLINGNIIANGGASFDHVLTKTGTGLLTIQGVGTTLDGAVNVNGGAVAITDFRSLSNNNAVLNLGTGTTVGSLIVGTSTAPTAAGLITNRVVNLAGTTAGAGIYANQTGTNPVVIRSNLTATGAGAKTLTLGGTNTAGNLIQGIIPNSSTPATAVFKAGPGTWVLSGANSYTGTTTLSNGVLRIQDTFIGGVSRNVLGTGAVIFNVSGVNQEGGGTFEYVGASLSPSAEAVGALTPTAGAATVRATGGPGGTAALTFASLGARGAGATVNYAPGAGGTIGFTTSPAVTNGILAAASGGTAFSTFRGVDWATVSAGTVVPFTGYTLNTFPATGTGGAAVNHALSANATTTGTASVNTLKMIGSGSNPTLTLGGILTLTAKGLLFDNSAGPATITGSQLGAVAVETLIITNGTNPANALTINSVIGGTTGSLNKSGSGAVIIGGANTYTGNTIINEGTVIMSGPTATLGVISTAGNVTTLRQGATLDINAAGAAGTITIGGLNGAGRITNSGGGTNSAGTISIGSGTSTAAGNFSGVLQDGAGVLNVVKNGTGTQGLLGLSTYTGSTTLLSSGSIIVDTLANIGSPSGIGAGNGTDDATNAASLIFGGTTGALIYQGNIRNGILNLGSASASTNRLFTIAGSGATLSSTVSNNNAVVWSNTAPILFTNAGPKSLTLTGTSAGDNWFNPQLSNNGLDPTSVSKTGTGKWVLGNSGNTYTGATTVANGILELASASSLPAGSPLVLGATTTTGLIEAAGVFDRGLAASAVPGAGTVTWGGTTGSGGFAASTDKLVVALGGVASPTPLQWGVGGFVGTGGLQTLILNSATALGEVEWRNAIDLNPGLALTPLVSTTSASTTVTTADTSSLRVGQPIAGPGIPANATIASITNATTFVISAAATATGLDQPATVSTIPRTVTINDNANTFTDFATITGVISDTSGDAGTFVKAGAGTLQLFGQNTYRGVTSVTAGTLVVRSLGNSSTPGASNVGASNFANTSGSAITLGNGTTGAGVLQYVGAGEVSDRMIRLNTTTGINQIHADGTGPLVLTNVVNDMAAGAKTLSLRGGSTANNVLFTGTLADNGGAFGLTVDAGTWILDGAGGTFTGAVTASAGALGLASDTALGTGSLALGSAGIFAKGGDRLIANPVSIVNNTTIAFTGDHGFSFSSPLVLGAAANNVGLTNTIAGGKTVFFSSATANAMTGARTWTINGSGDTVIGGDITTSTAFNLNLTYSGTGSLTLAGAGSNWNTGILTLSNGTLRLGANEVIPHGFAATSATTGDVTASTTVTVADTTGLVAGMPFTGPGVPAGSFVSSVIDSTSFVASTAQTLTTGAQLVFNPKGNVVLNPAVGITATLDVNGKTETINGLTATTAGSSVINNSSADAGSLTFGGLDQAVTFTGSINNTGAGALAIGKIGTGAALLSGGTYAHAGATTVAGGSLTFLGDVTATNAISVTGAGSSLAFNGGLSAASGVTSLVVGGGSTLSLSGDLAGTPLSGLTNLELGATGTGPATLNLNVGTANSDTISLLSGGTLALGNTVLFNLTDTGLAANQTYTLLSLANGGLNAFGLANLVQGITPGGFDSYNWIVNDNVVQLQVGNLLSGSLYWQGATNTAWNGNLNNWSTNKAGTLPATTLPGSGLDIVFQSDTAAGGALVTTLEQNFRIKSLTFEASGSTPASVAINPGLNANAFLDVAPTSASQGIALAAGAPATVTLSTGVKLGSNQTWSVADAGSTLNVSGALSGTGSLTKTGNGRLILGAAAATDFAVPSVAVNGGRLELGNALALRGTAIEVNTGGTLSNNLTATFNNSLTLNGGRLGAAGGTPTFSSPVSVLANSSIFLGDLNATAPTARQINLNGGVTGSGRLTVDSITTVSSGNQISGILTMNADSSAWTGGLNILRGDVRTTNVNGFGTGDINLTLGKLAWQGVNNGTWSIPNNITIGSPVLNALAELNIDNVSASVFQPFTANFNGLITLGSNEATGSMRVFLADGANTLANFNGGIVLANDGNIVVRDTATARINLNSPITENGGPRALSVNDLQGWGGTAGTIAFNAVNTHTGLTTLYGGTLIMGVPANSAFGGAPSLAVRGGTTLQANVNMDAPGTSAISYQIGLGANLGVSGTGNVVFENAISNLAGTGGGGLTITTTGTTLLSGLNTYSGVTTIGSGAVVPGTVTVGATGSLGGGAINILAGTLELLNGTQTINATGTTVPINMGNGPLGSTSTLQMNGGAVNLGGNVTYTASSTSGSAFIVNGTLNLLGTRTFTVNNSTQTEDEMVVTAVIADGDATARGLTKAGAGSLTLLAQNSYTGPTSVTNGILKLPFNTVTTPKLSGTGSLSTGGTGTFLMTGNASEPVTQTVNGLLTTGGTPKIIISPAGFATTLNVGAIGARSESGMLNFVLPDANAIVQTSSVNPTGSGIMAGWATVNSRNFATISGGQIIEATATPANNIATWLAGQDVTDTTGYTGTLASSLAINSLRFSGGASTVNVGAPLNYLTVNSGGILIAPGTSGALAITGGFLAGRGGAGAELIIHQNSTATSLRIASRLAGATIVSKSGEGALAISNSGNTYRGLTTIQEGVLAISGGSAVGPYSAVNLRNFPGVALDINNGTEVVGGLNGGSGFNGEVRMGTGTLTTNTNQASRTLTGHLVGTGTLIKTGINSQVMAGDSVYYTGNVVVNGGLFHLDGGSGRMNLVPSFVINGAEILSDQDQTSSQNRIGDAAVVTLNNTFATRGLWLRNENQGADRAETVGTVNLGSGHNVIQATTNGQTNGAVSSLIINTFNRQNFATALVRGQGLGSGASFRGRIRPAAEPAGAVGGTGAAGTTTRRIIPYLVGNTATDRDSDATIALMTGNSLVTWVSAGEGLRPLNLETEYVQNAEGFDALAGSVQDNVRFAVNPSAPLAAGSKTINALVLDSSAGTLNVAGNAGDSLTLASGALLATTNTTLSGLTYNMGLGGFSELLTGTSEYVTFVTNASSRLTLDPALNSVGASLTKAGAGTLVLTNNASTFTGGTRIHQGLIEVSSLGALGTGDIAMQGGGLRWASGASFDPSTRNLIFNTGDGILDTNGNDIAVAGALGTGAGGMVKAGAGILTLNAVPGYAGTTTLAGGTLAYGIQDALPVSASVAFDGGALDFGAFTGTLGNVFVNTLGAVNAAAPLTINGNVEVNGAGARTLTINNTALTTLNGARMILVDRGTTARTFTIDGTGNVLVKSELIDGTAAGTLAYAGSGVMTLDTANHTNTGAIQVNSLLGGSVVLTGTTRVNGGLTASAGLMRLDASGLDQTFAALTMGGGPAGLNVPSTTQAVFEIGAGRTIRPSTIVYSATNNNATSILNGPGTLDLGTAGFTVNIGNSTAVDIDMSWEMATLLGGGVFTKTGLGTLDIRSIGTNSFTGSYSVQQGAILGLDLLSNNLLLNGGVFEGNGSFTRALGAGSNEVQWFDGANGGFAANGGPLTVNLGGLGAPLTWRSTTPAPGGPAFFVSDAGQLLFGSASATDVVTFVHDLDLGGVTRGVQVIDNTAVTATGDKAVLSGVLTNGTLNKTGTGVLELANNANNLTGIVVTGGTLQFTTASNTAGVFSNLGDSATTLTLSGGTLSHIGAVNLDLARPITTTASSGLAANGTAGAITTYSGPITQAANNTLTLGGAGIGVISGGIIQPAGGATADLVIAAGSTATWNITGANTIIADDFLINGGTVNVESTVFSLADDVIVSNPGTVLNLNGTGVMKANNPAGTSSGLYSRNGAVINLNATDVYGSGNSGGLDFIMVGDATAGAPATFNINGNFITTPRMDVGGIAADLIGNVTGTGTITGTYTGTDYNSGFRFFRGSVAANLAGGTTVLKQGLQTVVLSGDNSGLTGGVNARTRVDSGTLVLDYTVNNNNKITDVRGLDLRGGAVTLLGHATNPTMQTVFDLTLANGGANTITLTPGAPGVSLTLNLGAITRATSGGTLRYNTATDAFLTTSTANGPHGLVGASGFLTIKDATGTWFARNDQPAGTGFIVPLVSTAKNDVTTWAAGDHVTDAPGGFSPAVLAGASINSLRFDAAVSTGVNIASFGALNIASGGILVTDNVAGGAPGIYGGALFSASGDIVITQDSTVQPFTLSSNLAPNVALTKTGNGTLILSGYNNYSGQTQIQGGLVQAIGGNAIGDNSPVTLADDRPSTLQLLASETIGRLAGGSVTATLNTLATLDVGPHTLTINNTGANTTFSGIITGTGSLVKNGFGTNTNLNVNNASPGFTGTVVVNEGLFQMSNVGRLDASSFTVQRNGSLLIDNNGTTRTGARILDSTPVILNSVAGIWSGETIARGLYIRTDQNAATNETIGRLIFNSGANYLGGQASGGASAVASLLTNDFIRSNNATVAVRGRNLGGTANERNQFRISNATNQSSFLISSNLIGGTGAAGTPSQKIVPWAIGESLTAAVGNANMGNSLVTYIADRGFVALNLATEYSPYSAIGNADNVRESFSADITGLNGRTLNALVLHNDNSAASTISFLGRNVAQQTLANTSGAFLFTLNPTATAGSQHSVTLGGFDGGITTSSGEFIFHVVNPSSAANTPTLDVAITSRLNSAADITKSGRGTLNLSGVSNAAGGGARKTTLNEGALVISDLDNIGGNSGRLVFGGGVLRLSETYSGDDLSQRNIEFLPGGGSIDIGLLDLVFANSLGSGEGGFTKLGAGSLTLNAPASYTGPTTLQAGTLILGADNAIGSGPLTLGGSTIMELNGRSISVGSVSVTGFSPSLNGAGSITSSGSVTFSNTGNTTVNADITAAGNFVKSAADTLSLNGANTFGGSATVSGGTLLISESLAASAITVLPGATLGGVGTLSGDVMLAGTLASPATLIPGTAAITSGKEVLEINGALTLGEHSIVRFALDKTNFTALDLDTLAYVDATTRFAFTAPNDYIPEPGSSFQVITWSNGLLPAGLSTVNLDLPTIAGVTWTWDVSFDSGLGINKGILRANGAQVPPTVQALPAQAVNTGDPVTFTANVSGSHAYLIQWQKDSVDIPGATGLVYTIPVTVPGDQGVYTVIATNEFGSNSQSANLTVRTTPVIDSQPQNRLATAGSNFTVPSVVLGPDPKTFTWTQNGAPITQTNVTGTATGTLSFATATLANAGTYQVGIENSYNTGSPVLSSLADVVVISQPASATVPEGNLATFSVTAAGNAAILPSLIYKWRRNGVPINDGAEFSGTDTPTLQVLATPATAGANYSVQVSGFTATPVTTNGALLSFGPVQVVITQAPLPQIVPVGGSISLSVQSTGGLPQTYQWRRNNAVVPGGSQPTLFLYGATTANAGAYTCVISNKLTTGSSTATTTAVNVAVVDTTPRRVVLRQGSGTTLSVTAAGTVTYQWFVDNGAPAAISGATTNKLVIPNNLAPGLHTYYCAVTSSAGTLNGGVNSVFVYNAAPQISATPFVLPNTVVSSPYEFVVPMIEGVTPGQFDHTRTAAKFTAKGLPPGLTIGADGVIRGRATTAGTYTNISITASNAIAPPSTVSGLSITVSDLDQNIIGDFTGPIARNAILNGNLGGSITFKTAKNGSYSGKLLMGTASYSFKGPLDVAVGNPNNPGTTIIVKRGGLTPVQVTFTLSAATQTITSGTITDGINSTTFTGWRNKWLKTPLNPTPAAEFAGYYTVGLNIQNGDSAVIPQGSGYASFTVNSVTGKLTVSGRLADGASFTTATYVGPDGQVLVYRTLYASTARGSVLGSLNILKPAATMLPDNAVGGTLNWRRPFNPSTKERLYRNGFQENLTAVGRIYVAPVGVAVMGINGSVVAPNTNAVVQMLEANVNDPALGLPLVNGANPELGRVGVLVNNANKVSVPDLAPVPNPRKVSVSINAKTGLVTIKFTLSQAHPFAGSPARITRAVTAQAMIIKDGLSAQQAVGYFLLPQLPANAVEKSTATPIQSGQALLLP